VRNVEKNGRAAEKRGQISVAGWAPNGDCAGEKLLMEDGEWGGHAGSIKVETLEQSRGKRVVGADNGFREKRR